MEDTGFLGRGWNFPPEFTNNGENVILVSDERDIKQSLEILFSTEINQRLNYPDFGCDLNKFVFEDVNHSLVIEIEDMILEAVDKYEPRIEVKEIEVTESEKDAHILSITIDYIILETNTIQNLVFTLNLY